MAPSPAPRGLPPCAALADYEGVLRELLLSYKEGGRHDVARPLGRLLAAVVAAGPGRPVLLVPIPATAAAARQRYGDHLTRLTGHAARTLRVAGWRVAMIRALRALPRPDSASLDRAGRARAAADSLRVRQNALPSMRRAVAAGAEVVLLDDIVTTGATLAAAARSLASAGIPVHRAAVLAATQRRTLPDSRPGQTT